MIPTIKDIINEQDYYRLKEAYMAKKKKKEHFEQAYDKKGRLKEAYMGKKKGRRSYSKGPSGGGGGGTKSGK